jgi:hypothetical protein
LSGHDEYTTTTSTEEEMTGRQQQEQRRYRGALSAALSSKPSITLRQGSEQQKPSTTLPTSTGSPP